jgi:transcriptional regulator with XRE-family HTH domain
MADHPSEGSRCGAGSPAGPSPAALIAAVREECQRRGLSLADVADRAGRADLVARMESGQAGGEEVLVADMAALGQTLGVSTRQLVARAEEIEREWRER